MSNTNTATRPVINSANPTSSMIHACEPLRKLFAAKYGCRETEWTAYFVYSDCASVKDEFGASWDICLKSKQIIPAL